MVLAKTILNLEIGVEEAAVLVDVTVGETVLIGERVDRVDRNHKDVIVESVLDEEGVDDTIAVLDADFPLFSIYTEPNMDEGFFPFVAS